MNVSEVYFDAVIGSATLDIYQTKSSGFILTVDSTQGYHKKILFLATRYPRIKNDVSNIFTLLPNQVWFATMAAVTSLTIIILVAILVYSNISSTFLKENINVSQVLMRLFAGITEPDNENWFKVFSTGEFL